jgi:fumarylacetoacetate (FAA) hydrolase family protein
MEGPEGFTLRDSGSLSTISRDPLDLVAQAIGPNHPYPDGMVLFLGTMLSPTHDRLAPGKGSPIGSRPLASIARGGRGRSKSKDGDNGAQF